MTDEFVATENSQKRGYYNVWSGAASESKRESEILGPAPGLLGWLKS